MKRYCMNYDLEFVESKTGDIAMYDEALAAIEQAKREERERIAQWLDSLRDQTSEWAEENEQAIYESLARALRSMANEEHLEERDGKKTRGPLYTNSGG